MPGDKATHSLLQHRLKIRHLILVKTVADQRSISKAAAVLHITQSAATKTLRELEESLGAELFKRGPRGVSPTAYGQALLRRADAILGEVHSAADEIAALKSGAAGRIVIGILRAAAPSLLPDAFLQARRQYPELAITVMEGTQEALLPSLRAGEIDFLVGYLTDARARDGLVQERLYADAAAIVARPGHPLARSRRLSLADLAERQWVLPGENSVLRRHVDAAFRAAGVEPPRGLIESHSTTLVQSFLQQSDLLAVLPRQVALQLERFGLAVVLPVAVPGNALPVGITSCAERPLKPAARTLIDILRRVARRA